MKLGGTQLIMASRRDVWYALMDAEILKKTIPGCESIVLTSDNVYLATVVAAVGPVKAKFTGKISMLDLAPFDSYKVSFVGEGGLAGGAEGLAHVSLVDLGPSTELRYEVEAKVSGKIAQIGSRLIDATASKLAGQFFARFSQVLVGGVDDTNVDERPVRFDSSKVVSVEGKLGFSTAISLTLPAWIWVGLVGLIGFYFGKFG